MPSREYETTKVNLVFPNSRGRVGGRVESTLSALHVFASSGQRFGQRSMKKPKQGEKKKKQ